MNNKIDLNIEMLKELEMVESNMVNTIFMYNKLTRE